MTMTREREVGGLRCSEVLEHLSDYVDGQLAATLRSKVDAHLAGCDNCSRFGGEYGAVVRALHARLGAERDVSPETARRLDEALRKK